METNEGVQLPDSLPEEKKENNKKEVSIRVTLFFDGTMNNKTNIENRQAQNEAYQNTRSKKYIIMGERVGKGDDSYENGFTNIVTLDKFTNKKTAEGFDISLKVYIEGAGTLNHKGDKTAGYALGLGEAGVKNKCQKGIDEAMNNILQSKVGKKSLNAYEHTIKQLTLDVFGFSRGAATARYCIYKLIKDPNRPITARLAEHGFEDANAELSFAGLFDTVSSHGIYFDDDVRALELDAVAVAKKVVHLAAADEYRENFSVTNIKSAGTNGIEFFMPGVHSDVGGSYHETETETENFIVNHGTPSDVKADRQALIDENWYTENELFYSEHNVYDNYGRAIAITAKSTANRHGIKNYYCNIPLKLMAKYAREQGIPIESDLEVRANKAIEKDPDLKELDNNIFHYMVTNRKNYKPLAPLLKKIRHKFMHMSAKHEMGLKPRFKNINGVKKRYRQSFDDQ